MKTTTNIKFYLTSFLFSLMLHKGFPQEVTPLQKGFINPPHSSKPIVWWHWTGSNVTKAGITKDLEWMNRVGIGGFQAFDVSIGGGQSVDKKVAYLSPEWLELIKHTASEAERLGLDMTMVTAAGWSETGGTWVKPQEAMKKLVWSQTSVVGGKKIATILAQPPSVNGAIRNLPKTAGFASGQAKDPIFYADERVLAYRTPLTELENSIPKITNQKGEFMATPALLDDDLTSQIQLDVPTSEASVYLQFEYAKSFTARSFSFAIGGAGMFPSAIMRQGYVQASEDGKTYKTLFALPGAQHDIRALPVRTFSFPAITAKFFRVVFIKGNGITTVGGPDDFGGFGMPATAPTTFSISEAIFSSGARVNRWEDKANFAPMFAFESLRTPSASDNSVIKMGEVIDLTANMKADGSLEWEAPVGNWTILRLGYSLTGAKNAPAMPEATGYEVDKLSKDHLQSYLRQWSNPIIEAIGKNFGKSMKYYLVDSYEADAQNWTEKMIPEFRSRRGYDPIRFLPVLTGKIVESAEISDRFLWDFRLTIAELLVDNHYAAITEMAHQQSVKTYGEVAGISMPIIQDALRTKNAVDIPMAEFGMGQGLGSDGNWTSPADLGTQKAFGGANDRLNAHQSDVREAASAAHIYGKKIVGAEAWTGGGYEAPADLKFIGDYWMTQGINQLIFHTSAHQPLDTKPGNTMVGTHFHRNITWAEQAKPFVTYISRNQFMLQEGRSVADIAYYLGEDIPAVVPYWEKLKNEAPDGYDYDFVNTEILNRFEVQNGDLVLPSGMRYKVLVLPEKTSMTLHVLTKIADLVQKGATIVGPKPDKSPSLMGYPNEDKAVADKANEVWGIADGQFIFQNKYGKGQVFWNAGLAGILGQMNLRKDFDYTKSHINTKLSWIHRKTNNADWYFVLNMRNQAEDLEIQCNVGDKVPTLWYADKGETKAVSYKIEQGTTSLKVHLEAKESAFIVFEKAALQNELIVDQKQSTTLLTLDKNWTLTLPENSKLTKSITLGKLDSWSNSTDDNVKYFSGTAIYRQVVEVKKEWLNKANLWLDLGVLKDIAEVSINGVVMDTLWKAPYKTMIVNALKAGKNIIEVKVTNQWDNRIIGDRTLPIEKKILDYAPIFGVSAALKESGLIGPVVLRVE